MHYYDLSPPIAASEKGSVLTYTHTHFKLIHSDMIESRSILQNRSMINDSSKMAKVFPTFSRKQIFKLCPHTQADVMLMSKCNTLPDRWNLT